MNKISITITPDLEKLNAAFERALQQMRAYGMLVASLTPADIASLRKYERDTSKARARSQRSNAARRPRKHGRHV